MQLRLDKKFFYAALSVVLLMGIFIAPPPGFTKDAANNPVEKGDPSEQKALPAHSQGYEQDEQKDSGNKILAGTEGLELGGVLMWDYDHFKGAHIKNVKKEYQRSSHSELRRASLELSSTLNKNWRAKFQANFNDDDSAPDIEDASIQFTGWDYALLTIGKDKEPFGLEELTNSKDITTIERAMSTNAFAPGHHPGIGLSGNTDTFTWAIGVYEAINREKKRDTYALTGRVTFTPWHHKNNLFHLGIAGSVRDFGREEYQIEERAEAHTAEKIVTSAKTLAKRVDLLGFEAAWVEGPFSLQAEYMTAYIDADTAINDATYTGYYLQGSYFLTGESRPYKKGVFSRIKPVARYGALELVSRYSVLDASDDNKGDKAANLTLGINYYLNKQVRLMGNYINTHLTGDMLNDSNANALSFRMQYSF